MKRAQLFDDIALDELGVADGPLFDEPDVDTDYVSDGMGGFKPAPPDEPPARDPMLPVDPAQQMAEHRRNLAEDMDSDVLDRLANDLLEEIDQDIQDRAPWANRFKLHAELSGLHANEMDDGPFPGASTVVHPVLSNAYVQFWSRAMGETAPTEGPVKVKALGQQHMDILRRAQRVEDYMNYEIMTIDRSWYREHSRTLFNLPSEGSSFKKIYPDPIRGSATSVYVAAEDVIIPYGATDLMSAPRITHRMRKTGNEVKKLMRSGFYRDLDLMESDIESGDDGAADEVRTLKNTIADTENQSEAFTGHVIYEVSVDLDLAGYPDIDPVTGEETGIAIPYMVSIDRDSGKILSIYRNWKVNDPLKLKLLHFVQYDYLPGYGIYGFGLVHFMGGIQQAATGALRVLLDGAATASLQGGFVSKDANIKSSDLIVEPGIYRQIDATSEELQRAFFTPPFKEPSAALFQVLNFLTQHGEKFTSTTEAMTGEQDAKGSPVGSVMAIIEQGSKVHSAIHRGLHLSLQEELRKRYDIIVEGVPEQGYPYFVGGQEGNLMAQDFGDDLQIQPVSDPNIFSNAQRLSIAQGVVQLSTQFPQIVKPKVAVTRMLEAMRVPNIEELVEQDAAEPPPMDPVLEVQAFMMGKPVKVYPEQPHKEHIDHYVSFINNPQFGGNPLVAQQIGAQVQSIIAQRLSFLWVTHVRAHGIPAAYLDPRSGQPMMPSDQNGQQQPMPPPEQIAMAVAQIAPQMAQVPGLPAVDQPGEAGGQQEIQLEREKMQAQMQMKQSDTQIKVEQSRQKLAHEQEMHQFKMQMEREKMDMQREMAQLKSQLEQHKAMAQQQAIAQKASIEQQAMQREAQMAEQQAEADMQSQYQQQAIDHERLGMEREGMVAEQQMRREGMVAEQQTQREGMQMKAATDREAAAMNAGTARAMGNQRKQAYAAAGAELIAPQQSGTGKGTITRVPRGRGGRGRK